MAGTAYDPSEFEDRDEWRYFEETDRGLAPMTSDYLAKCLVAAACFGLATITVLVLLVLELLR